MIVNFGHLSGTNKVSSKTLNFLNCPLYPRYSSGVLSPGRHVRTRLYFTSESHIHSLLTILSEGGLVDVSQVCFNSNQYNLQFSSFENAIILYLLLIFKHLYFSQSNDEQWQRAMEYVSLVSELNYMTQVRNFLAYENFQYDQDNNICQR